MVAEFSLLATANFLQFNCRLNFKNTRIHRKYNTLPIAKIKNIPELKYNRTKENVTKLKIENIVCKAVPVIKSFYTLMVVYAL